MLTVGKKLKVTAIDIDYQGQGICKIDGYVLFVKGLLDKEEAIIEVIKVNKSFGFAQIIERLTTSPDRRLESLSPFGSMDLAHLSVEKQKAWQIKTTQETIRKIAQIDVNIERIISDDRDVFYRNKAVFHVMDEPFLKLGLYHYSNQYLIQTETFELASEPINQVLKHLAKNSRLINPKVFKHLVLRSNPEGQVLVTLVADHVNFLGRDEIVDVLKTLPFVCGITLNIQKNPKHILGEKSIVLYGENSIIKRIQAFNIPINDRTFHQINTPVIHRAYQMIKDQLIPTERIIDAYGGVGSIGLFLHHPRLRIDVVETNPESIQIANWIKQTYQLDHFQIIEGKSEEIVSHLDADVLIVDPPRHGLASSLLETINNKKFRQVFYLSCDVKTLARDLKVLNQNYQIEQVVPIRMFPHTTSIETMVILESKA